MKNEKDKELKKQKRKVETLPENIEFLKKEIAEGYEEITETKSKHSKKILDNFENE